MGIIPQTPGIPDILYTPLRDTLMDCEEFTIPSELRTVFDHDKLLPFKNSLPMAAAAVGGRVDETIGYLRNKYLITQENALTIFLNVMAEKRNKRTALHQQLKTLAQKWEWYRQLPYDEPEALNLEANPQQVQMLYMADAEKMLENARAVARVNIRRFRHGQARGDASGTGWLLAPLLALTCWHVIEALSKDEAVIEIDDLQSQIDNALLTFDYVTAGEGLQYKIDKLEYPTLASHPLDYALLRLQDRSDAPLLARGYLRLDADTPLTAQTALYIIQHPLGQPQQGAGDNYIRPSPIPHRILYKTPTEPGTSGAPVFNRANWRVVALHNRENQAAGLREGTLLKAILADVQQHRPDLYDEIMNT